MEVAFGPKRLLIETIYDIRELKSIQSSLSSMLTEIETISDASANGVRVLAIDGTILRINRTLSEWHQCDRNEVVGKLCEEVFEESLLARELAILETGEENAKFETELHFDGTMRICVVSASPMRDPDGTISAIIEDIADVTELRLSEIRTREAMLELNYVLGSTSSAIRVVDLDFNMLRVNRSFSTWTGIPEQNLLQLKCFEATSSECCHTERCPITRIRNGETHVSLESENTLPSGKKMFCLVSASPYFDSHGKLKGIMEDLTDITRRKSLEDEILARSLTDELTGLYNRRGFFDVAERDLLKARRNHLGASVFFIDLDNLKTLNDTQGHEEGDRAIIDTANILKQTFRNTDVLCRLGGDEFVVFTEKPGEDHIQCVLKRLEKTTAEFNGMKAPGAFRLEMSVGCVLFDPERHPSLESLLAEADALMYEIKQKKKKAAKRA
jgi:diguanylate cyclase (GGDEF)-like protein/PAS domain S-box-containing protein